MNIETLVARMSDTGIENNTLLSILNIFFETGTINVRRLSLPNDKKVKNSEILNRVDIINKENFIFKSIINKLDEISIDRLNDFGIDNTIILKLKSLTDEQIKLYIDKQIIPNNDRSILNVLVLIHGMSRINDTYGSQKKSIFETKPQESKYKKRVKNPEQYTKRIYLNIPLNKVGIEFLTLFKVKCIEKGIPSKMKGMGSSGYDEGDLDTTIIYSNDFYILDHVDILESLVKERPDLFKNFGTPVISGARVKSNDGECYYTISSGLLNDTTPNSYYNDLYKISFAILCAKYNTGIDFNINLIDVYSNMKLREFNTFIFEQKNILKENIKNNKVSMEILVEDYKGIIKQVSSYLRFGDLNHFDTPLYQDEIFVNLLDKTKIRDKQKENQGNNNMKPEFVILFQTESLIDLILEEFSNSNLLNKEKSINYINKINDLFRKFEVYSRLLNGFRDDARYFEVIEYFKSIPMFQLYQEDNTKGNGINMALANRYYDEVADIINFYIENKNNAKKI